ncbi:TPA: hypothetical protein ACX3HX_004222, partial [Raoultella ornithinolytica]
PSFDNSYQNHYQTHCYFNKSPAAVGAGIAVPAVVMALIKTISCLLKWTKNKTYRSAVLAR